MIDFTRHIIRSEGSPVSGQDLTAPDRYGLKLSAEDAVLTEDVTALFSFEFRPDDVIFVNGYQSWTYSPERLTGQTDTALKYCPALLRLGLGLAQYGDGHFNPRKYEKHIHYGYTYAYIRRGEQYILIGSLCEDTGFTRITFNTADNVIRVTKDCAGRRILGEYRALELGFFSGTSDAVFDAWFAAMGIKPLPATPKTGYTSWYNCYQNISESQILRDLDGMAASGRKLDIFQVDDGFESYVGDWLDVNPAKFPDGMKPIASAIRDRGLTAGIWLAPFVCERKSALAAAHPDWILRKPDGKPVFAGSNWSGAYALDFYNPAVRQYITDCVRHYRDMGFSLFKLDFLYAACMLPRPERTRGEIMAEAMEFLREVCSPAEILGCGVPLASAFGRVQYCRIGPDMSLSYDDKLFMRAFHNERPSTMHTQRNTFYRRQLNGRAFLNDPDVFLLRDDNTSLTKQQKTTLAAVNALFGSVLFCSDDFGSYDGKKRAWFGQLLDLGKARILSCSNKISGKKHLLEITYVADGQQQSLSLVI